MSGTKPELSPEDLEYQARLARERLYPRVARDSGLDPTTPSAQDFERRLLLHFPRLFGLLHRLYGGCADFYFHLEQILVTLAHAWNHRPDRLRDLDNSREFDPSWYLSRQQIGGALYVDLFSNTLTELRSHVPYFRDLGLTYIHLMPLFAVPDGPNDGGYAISNYRAVRPELGSLDDLKALSRDLHEVGISLTLDFVFNHTADTHEWAILAQSGERFFREFYYTFPDRTLPDQYERTLREIFPTVRRGNFTWHDEMRRWVWTTFNSYQWDLNYTNPAVFRAMLDEMLFISNMGVDILRLDAVAFIWKQMGTVCENLPEAHLIIQAFNAACRIAAPALVFKSEAIVHPDEVVRYVSQEECQLSYNPTLMALLWESIATRKTSLLQRSLSHRHALPDGSTWCNYLRCHDDIGWSFDDGDAWAVGINPWDHRQFLNRFYTGQFPGTFARGIPFQFNPDNGDMRISGTLASLAGLEQALDTNDEHWLEMALRRIRLLYSVVCSIGGIPLIYLGEEWGLLNDYEYIKDPSKADDSRWVHRPRMNWNLTADRHNRSNLDNKTAIHSRLFNDVVEINHYRKALHALDGSQMQLIPIENPHVLAYHRRYQGHRLCVLANFADKTVTINPYPLRSMGLGHFFENVFDRREITTSRTIELPAYECLWLREI